MKKISVRLLACLFSFALGSGAVLVWLFYQTANVSEVAQPAPLDSACVKTRKFPALARKISEIEKGKSGFFPKNVYRGYAGADDFMNDWYGKHLRAMSEKSLLDAPAGQEIYRFLWLRTFRHPIFVRVERRQNEFKLFTKELNGAGGYEPREVLRDESRNLDQTEWCEFLKLLEQANYWALSTDLSDDSGNDGAQWILEGVKENRYHVVDRWTPRTGEYRAACLYLLRLSGVEVDKMGDELY